MGWCLRNAWLPFTLKHDSNLTPWPNPLSRGKGAGEYHQQWAVRKLNRTAVRASAVIYDSNLSERFCSQPGCLRLTLLERLSVLRANMGGAVGSHLPSCNRWERSSLLLLLQSLGRHFNTKTHSEHWPVTAEADLSRSAPCDAMSFYYFFIIIYIFSSTALEDKHTHSGPEPPARWTVCWQGPGHTTLWYRRPQLDA